MAGDPSGKGTLSVKIIDKETGEPVEDAIFYVGNGFSIKQTDREGKCMVAENNVGSYAVNAYKRGYERYSDHITLEEGENRLMIELVKDESSLPQISVEGEVVDIIAAEGTKSENHFIKIRYDDGEEDYLFNKIGYNRIDGEFIGKKVRIQGYKDMGFIGWQHQEQEGIYVEKIEVVGFFD
ncbi:hypothetical protein GF345_05155 [Candidatus Woesearchaeota archaeon]|nr:hypothetical protein [Candidatus Woesearchaeota archaeon]